MTIGIVGLNHLGVVSAITTAHKGYPVIAYDVDAELISKLQQGIFPCYEPNLETLYKENSFRINWTIYPHLLAQCNLIFITVDTPIDEKNKSNYDSIFWLLKIITRYIDEDIPIIISSQVYPGFTRNISEILPNPVYYQPEFLVVGNAIELSYNPIQIVIGSINPIPKIYRDFLNSFDCPITQVSFESAEMIKISTNIYLAAQVAATNTLAEVCENIGADWREIEPTLRHDKRIGSYLIPGLGLSGGHLERDLETINSIKTVNQITNGVQVNSNHRRNWVNTFPHTQLYQNNNSNCIGILGLTYKPNVNSMQSSPGLYTLNYLHSYSHYDYVKFQTYDPYNIITEEDCISCTCPEDATRNADILCILTADQRYSKLDLENIKQHMKGNIIIDPYGMLNHEECIKIGFKHFQLGVPVYK
jgi:UDPglucose 6-dehydrogenase